MNFVSHMANDTTLWGFNWVNDNRRHYSGSCLYEIFKQMMSVSIVKLKMKKICECDDLELLMMIIIHVVDQTLL